LTDFDAWTLAICVAGAAAGTLVSVGPALARRTPATAALVLLAFVVAGAVALVGSGIVVPRLGLRVFGVMRALYLACVVVVPFVGATVLLLRAAGRIRATRPALAAAALGVGAAAVGVWATYVEPYRLVVERADVPVLAERGDDVRIGVFADLQTDRVGAYEEEAVARLLAEAPDVILVPGDLFQGWPGELEREEEALRALLARLDAPGGVYFVRGDTDEFPATTRILRGTKIRFLADEVVRTTVRGRTLAIGGVSSWARGPGLPPGAAGVVRELERAEDADARILMAHPPDVALCLEPPTTIDLVVAGHTHGGQVVVPGYGPPVTLSRVARHVAAGGLHEVGGTRLYVSRGIGMERIEAPRLRLFCPPEISVLTLSSSGPSRPAR
jgi:hypothetical protein